MSTVQTTIVMTFGGLLAVIAVMMLLFTRTHGTNHIRAFGVEFELSTPALVVFLAGCALIVAPFVVGVRVDRRGDGGSDVAGPSIPDGPTSKATVTCDDGKRFGLLVEKSSVVDGIRTVPVRLQNLNNETVGVYDDGLFVSDKTGAQIEPVDEKWTPVLLDLAAGTSFAGWFKLREDPHGPEEVIVKVTPDSDCRTLSAGTRF